MGDEVGVGWEWDEMRWECDGDGDEMGTWVGIGTGKRMRKGLGTRMVVGRRIGLRIWEMGDGKGDGAEE